MGPSAAVILATLVVLLVVLLILARHLWRYSRGASLRRFPRALVSGAFPLMKTGDLLFFMARPHPFHNSLGHSCLFSHVGIVAERPGDDGTLRLVVSESSRPYSLMPDPDRPGEELQTSEERGAFSAPLLTRLKFYCGELFWAPLAAPLPPDVKGRLDRLAEEADGFPYPGIPRQTLEILLGLRSRVEKERHCGHHVAWLLDQIGLTPADADRPLAEERVFEVMRKVFALPGRPLGREGGNQYLGPFHLLYDLDAVGGEDPGREAN